MDKNGKVVVPLEYDDSDFVEGIAWVKIFGKWIMIDKNGKIL
ncbi:WG repeat-containing protein [Campylobacter majalis]